MSSVEIEDVLSSIRRLVSEDMRPAAAATPPKPDMPAPQAAASKLILTPALRVVVDDLPAAVADPVPEPWDDSEVAAFVNVEDDAVFEDDADWQPKADVVSLTQLQEPQRPKAGTVAEPAPEIAPAPEPQLSAPSVEAPIEAAPADTLAWRTQTDAALADWDDALPEQPPVSGDAMPEPLDADWADAAEAEVLRQLADEGLSRQAAPQAAPLSEDDMIYEENLLRDLVRDIIREELQGELGERITRNVRKLVRAEIARAMALRDFD